MLPTGLCSNYLDRSTEFPAVDLRSSFVDVAVHDSTFRLPKDVSVPIIMVGPGTGIAPMRAFLQERQYQQAQGDEVGTAVLYFGCRNSAFIFFQTVFADAATPSSFFVFFFFFFSRGSSMQRITMTSTRMS